MLMSIHNKMVQKRLNGQGTGKWTLSLTGLVNRQEWGGDHEPAYRNFAFCLDFMTNLNVWANRCCSVTTHYYSLIVEDALSPFDISSLLSLLFWAITPAEQNNSNYAHKLGIKADLMLTNVTYLCYLYFWTFIQWNAVTGNWHSTSMRLRGTVSYRTLDGVKTPTYENQNMNTFAVLHIRNPV